MRFNQSPNTPAFLALGATLALGLTACESITHQTEPKCIPATTAEASTPNKDQATLETFAGLVIDAYNGKVGDSQSYSPAVAGADCQPRASVTVSFKELAKGGGTYTLLATANLRQSDKEMPDKTHVEDVSVGLQKDATSLFYYDARLASNGVTVVNAIDACAPKGETLTSIEPKGARLAMMGQVLSPIGQPSGIDTADINLLATFSQNQLCN